MKPTVLFSLLFLLFVLHAAGQTPVDRLTDELQFQSSGTITGWKYATTVTGDPRRSDFDDKTWTPLSLNESLSVDSCWIRKVIVLPSTQLGIPIRGKVRFLLSIDDYGYLWVNGHDMGKVPWDGECVLTDSVRPGERFVIAVKAINTGGPLRLIRARFQTEIADTLARTMENLAMSLRVGQKLLSFDTYQTNARQKSDPGTDRSSMNRKRKEELGALLQNLAAGADLRVLRTGTRRQIQESLFRVRAGLAPIREYARRFTLYFDANAHIDAAWLWRECETIEVCKKTFASVLNMMDQRPDFTYTQSAAAYYDWMERLSPDLFQGIKRRVSEGRWEVVGGMWVEPDCNLPAGESWTRHLLYGKRFFKQKLGVATTIGWNPDSFGYNGNMPMFYANAGITAFITQKIGWNETNVFPHRVFWWESPDRSRILSYFPFDYVNTIDNPFALVDWLRQFEANTGFTKMLLLFGVGDHGGGPSLEMIDRIERLKELDVYPAIEFGTARTYLGWLEEQDLATLPVWKDELYLEYHQGTFTTQAAMKNANRRNEVLLTNAEKFGTLASLYGRRYNRPDMETAWRHVMLMQFHDILPGSSIREVYIDATETHRQAEEIGMYELQNSLGFLARRVNTSAMTKGRPVVVFNPLAWTRTDLVRVDLSEGDAQMYQIFDRQGNEIPGQTVQQSRYRRQMLFIAQDVPSLGYATYELRPQTDRPQILPSQRAGWTIENTIFRVDVDSTSGWVKSIVDKRTGRELLAGPGNELQLLEDTPTAWDAWNIGLTGTQFPSRFRGGRVVETGPVRTVLRLERDYLKPGMKKEFPTEDFPSTFFTQDITLYNGLPRIDFTTDVDWWEDKTMLKVAFPLAVHDSIATYEIPYGTIRRSTQERDSWEKARREVPALRWADVSTGGYGVSLLNEAKYGYDIKGNVVRLSLLRSPKWPDPTADRGKQIIAYALYPHAGDWREGRTVRRGYEYNTPLYAVVTDAHPGDLGIVQGMLGELPPNIILTTLKKAEDSDAWVVQWYEAEGRDTNVELDFPKPVISAVMSNFLEERGVAIPAKGRKLIVPTRGHGVNTIIVEL
jgi:alpha-mannosidase